MMPRRVFFKLAGLFRRKGAAYRSEKVRVFDFPLEPRLAFTAGILRNYDAYEELYFTSVDVATAVDLLAHFTVAGGVEFVGDEKDVERVRDFARRVGLRSRLINDVRTMLIYGNCYELIARDGGELTLQYLNPKKVKVRLDEYGEIVSYVYGVAGGDVELDPKAVMHFAYGRIGNSPYGYSLVHQAYATIRQKQKIEKVAAILAHRMSHPLLHGRVPDPAKIQELKDVLEERVRERPDREEIEILNQIVTTSDVEISVLSSQLDVQGIVSVLEFLQDQVDKALKVPRVFMGLPEGSNRATSYNQLKAFSLFINSLRDVIAEELERKLFPALGVDVEVQFEEVLKEDEMAWADIATKLYQYGVATLNEARAFVGLPPLGEEEEE